MRMALGSMVEVAQYRRSVGIYDMFRAGRQGGVINQVFFRGGYTAHPLSEARLKVSGHLPDIMMYKS